MEVVRHPSPECKQALEDRSSPAIQLENTFSAGVPKSPSERLTGGRPEVAHQAAKDDGERHEVQPEWRVVLQICEITGD
jgi:hypothetical protein